MAKKLYLLVTSERPDPYLNSIVHCLSVEGVRAIEFIHIEGWGASAHSGDSSEGQSKALTVSRRVGSLLDDLASNGEYRDFESEKTERVKLDSIYPATDVASILDIYRQCRDLRVAWSQRDIVYGDLRKELRKIAREGSDSMVDISAVGKNFLGDIIAVSVVEGLDCLYTFELLRSPDFARPMSMLFHELRSSDGKPAKYRFTNVARTPIYSDCIRSILIRRPPLKWAVAISSVLFLAALGLYYLPGASGWFGQGLLISSSVASLLSLLYAFVPIRGS